MWWIVLAVLVIGWALLKEGRNQRQKQTALDHWEQKRAQQDEDDAWRTSRVRRSAPEIGSHAYDESRRKLVDRNARLAIPVPAFDPSARLMMEYRDSAGAETMRAIDLAVVDAVERYDPEIDGYRRVACNFVAFCHLRQAWRSFRSDRITSLAFAETGEVIENPEGYILQGAGLAKVMAGDGFSNFWRKIKPGLAVLTWIAMADRELSEAEVEALSSYARERDALAGAPSADWNEGYFRYRASHAQFIRADADAAMARFSAKEADLVRRHALLMVAANGAADEAAEKRRRQLYPRG